MEARGGRFVELFVKFIPLFMREMIRGIEHCCIASVMMSLDVIMLIGRRDRR